MSHITNINLRIRDLDALAEAAERCGLELRREQKSHAWFGRFVGDSAPPPGRDPRDYGKCDHALRLKDHRSGDYEIGVTRALDGDGFDLLMDNWGTSGRRLMEAGDGPQLNRLRREYSAAVAMANARRTVVRKGFVPRREDLPGGRIRVVLVKR